MQSYTMLHHQRAAHDVGLRLETMGSYYEKPNANINLLVKLCEVILDWLIL